MILAAWGQTIPSSIARLFGERVYPGRVVHQKLVRKILLSQAFRQNGVVTQKGREIDPANRLLHHYPTRRLEAEAIRDSLLFVAGRLDEKLYGRPILPPDGRGWRQTPVQRTA